MADTAETHINVRFRNALLRVSGWDPADVVGDEGETGDLFIGRQIKPDLVLTLPAHPPALVECKKDNVAADPVEDAKRKLGAAPLSDKVSRGSGEYVRKGIAMRYPPEAKDWPLNEMEAKFLGGAEVRWKFVTQTDGGAEVWPEAGYLTGTISDFASSVENSSADVSVITEAGVAVASHVSAAAAALEGALRNHPGEVERISARMGYPGNPEAGLRVACVVWFDSLLILNELSRAGKPYKSVDACRTQGRLDGRKVKEAWELVLEENYRSIFDVAVECYPQVMSSPDYRGVFNNLDRAVEAVEDGLLGKTANIGGEVFARVMDGGERKKSAAFYTRPENAEFLAHAVLPDRAGLPSDPGRWRIADFACGTGALLRAGYRRLRKFADAEPHPPPQTWGSSTGG